MTPKSFRLSIWKLELSFFALKKTIERKVWGWIELRVLWFWVVLNLRSCSDIKGVGRWLGLEFKEEIGFESSAYRVNLKTRRLDFTQTRK